jgi:hypothetical protein
LASAHANACVQLLIGTAADKALQTATACVVANAHANACVQATAKWRHCIVSTIRYMLPLHMFEPAANLPKHMHSMLQLWQGVSAYGAIAAAAAAANTAVA